MSKAADRLEAIGQRWIDDVAEARISSIPKVLYHYTDATGLEGMLKSGKLWLTDYRFVNDKTEFTFAKNILSQVVNERLAEGSEGQKEFYREILTYDDLSDPYAGFIYSLTSEKDDLSQWRGYGNEGLGFTVGLSGHALHEKAGDPFTFGKVNYEASEEVSALNSALTQMQDQLALEISKNPDAKPHLEDQAGMYFEWLARNRAAFIKHNSFRAEDEWRLVGWRLKVDPVIKARVSGFRVIPYLEIQLSDDGLLPIECIGVGPGFTGSEVVDAVRYLAATYGYKPEIYSADTPYRRP